MAAVVGVVLAASPAWAGLGGPPTVSPVSFVNGATATMKVGPIRLSALWTHVTPQGAGGGVDWLDGMVCGGPAAFAFCARTNVQAGDVIDRSGAVRNAYAIQIGWTLAVRQKF